MNNAITEIKSTLEGTNSRITEAEDRISEVEDRMVEINETERTKEKKEKKWGQPQRLLGQYQMSQYSNHRSPKKEDKKKDHEKILEEIIVENFPAKRKEIAIQVQETPRVPNRINARWNTSRYINQINKDQTQRANIKSSKGKATNNTQGDSHKDNSWSFNRNSSDQERMAGQVMKEKNLQPRLLYPARISFKYEGEI